MGKDLKQSEILEIQELNDEVFYLSQQLRHIKTQNLELSEQNSILNQENKSLVFENKQLQEQTVLKLQHTSQIENLLDKLTEAHKKILDQKVAAVKNDYEAQIENLSLKYQLTVKDLNEKTDRCNELASKLLIAENNYFEIKALYDKWEGEKKRFQIDLAKSRSKQFSNELQQFTDQYQTFVQRFVNDSQLQTQRYTTECFERLSKSIHQEISYLSKKMNSASPQD